MNIRTRPTISRSDLVSVLETMIDQNVGYGTVVESFQKKFSEFLKVPESIVVNNHQNALLLLLKYLDLVEGDEVIISAYVRPFVVETLAFLKLKPVFVDIVKEGYVMDTKQALQKVNEKTKVIIISHLFGYPADVTSLMGDGKKNYKVIEDCSDALGGIYDGVSVGKKGDYGLFSFDIHSSVSTLSGGAVISKDVKEISNIRKHLLSGDVVSDCNSRLDMSMSDIQGAMGISELSLLSKIQNKKREIGQYYIDCARRSKLRFIHHPNNYEFPFNYFPLVCDSSISIVEELFKKKKISIQKPINRLYYADWNFDRGAFEHTNTVFAKLLEVPIYSLLKKEEIELIGKLIGSME